MPVKQVDILIQRIKDWSINLQYYKKVIDRDDCKNIFIFRKLKTKIRQSKNLTLYQTVQKINQLSIQIKKRFQSSQNWPHADKIKAQKFQKDFINKMQVYTNLLNKYKQRKATELSEVRQSYTVRRNTIKKKKDSDDQSQTGPQIQLQDVNQQTLFQQHMIQLKQKQLLQIKDKMEQALKVQKQVGKLVNAQGQKINIIQDNVDSARSNVKQAGNLLQEGVQHHKSATRKKMCIIGIIFIALIVIIVPIIVKVIV